MTKKLAPARGAAGAQKITWNPSVWRKHLAGVPGLEVIDDLASVSDEHSQISRQQVRSYSADPRSMLVAAMVWGFGVTGYGASRTRAMLTEDPRGGGTTDEVLAQICLGANGNPADAFSNLFAGGKARIPQLGIAMGTKLLYFAGAAGDGPRPLVLDLNVFRGLQEVGEKDMPDPRKYTTSESYASYCKWCDKEAAALKVAADDVEIALFELGRGAPT